jgi:hypothetical protein
MKINFRAENENDKQRMKINAKLGFSGPYFPGSLNSGTQIEEEKVYFREDFVPPEMSIVNFFINRVNILKNIFHAI